MTDDHTRHLHGLLLISQDKYTYFLLAAGASGIALAANGTSAATLAPSLIPLGLAVLSWGGSFWCGCRRLAYVNATLYANTTLSVVQSGEHPDVGNHPQAMDAASKGIRSAAEGNAERANAYGHSQFRLLVLGAVFYLAWHVLGMYFRTIAANQVAS